MQRVSDKTEFSAAVDRLCAAIDSALGSIGYRKEGTEDTPSRDKPLAQGKPARSRAAGKPAAGRRKARKGSKPK